MEIEKRNPRIKRFLVKAYPNSEDESSTLYKRKMDEATGEESTMLQLVLQKKYVHNREKIKAFNSNTVLEINSCVKHMYVQIARNKSIWITYLLQIDISHSSVSSSFSHMPWECLSSCTYLINFWNIPYCLSLKCSSQAWLKVWNDMLSCSSFPNKPIQSVFRASGQKLQHLP